MLGRPTTVLVSATPKVKAFLNSVSRNSLKTMKSYASALVHLQNFIEKEYPGYDTSTIIDALAENKINVYQLLDGFVSYIQSIRVGMTPKSVLLYMTALRSYFAYQDIDIIPSKYKRKVMVPKVYREDEEPIDVSDMRTLLLACSNRRLKAYLLVLASGGMRAVEGLAIRNKDIDFSVSPTRIRLRKEFSKTRVARDIYISSEATQYLRQFLDHKYKNPEHPRKFNEDDLVFTVFQNAKSPEILYQRVWFEFQKLLATVKMDKKKESGINSRHQISLHSIRRMVKTIIATQTNTDYSEYYLGHFHSPYWTMKEPQRREIYATRAMRYLTFLDYSHLEATGKNIEAKLAEKDREIAQLQDKDTDKEDTIKQLSDRLLSMDDRMQQQEKMIQQLLKKKE